MALNPVRWPAEAVWEAVEPLLPGFSVEVLPEIDSTNTELMRRARAGRHEPVLLVAERQTAGRGRMGRVWQDGGAPEAGELPSLMFSLGLPLAPADWSGLSLAVGLSVAESLDPDARAGLGLKWPNDLWRHDCKLAGILIETAGGGAAVPGQPPVPRYVVIGIGINVLQRPIEGTSTPLAALRDWQPQASAPDTLLRVIPPLVAMVLALPAAALPHCCPAFWPAMCCWAGRCAPAMAWRAWPPGWMPGGPCSCILHRAPRPSTAPR